MPANTPRIDVIDLVKTYRRDGGASIRPIDNVNLTVSANELVVLLGPSGCGKTTLLRCVAGLERPDEGEIVIDGKTVFSSRKGVFVPPDRRELAMVFQSYALWPHMTVAENVAYPLRSRKVASGKVDERVSEVLNMVGVGGLERQHPGRISGGQQQRVALARALVANSSVVLLDEPLSNVDAQVRAQLRFELKNMQRRLGFSGLYVTHDQTEAMELGHRVAVLDSGRISAIGTPEDIYNYPPNEYVASFVGTANIWSGVVQAVDGPVAVVRTALGDLKAKTSPIHPISLTVGQAISVVARPEKLGLSRTNASDGTNPVRVNVEARLFSGSHTELVVAGGNTRISVWMHEQGEDPPLQPGETAWLTAFPHHLRLVPAATDQVQP